MRTLPGKVTILKVGGRSIRRDEAGFLLDPEDWDEDVARVIAEEENITLQDEHWAIINFIRDYLDAHQVAADARFAFAFLAEQKNCGKRQARQHFFKLFPYGYVKQACKIAGLRQPRAWSTG
ncbi:MAG TPA: TusE/DsrC/DsvC family sulfur relay protein [Rhizobiales bacterium]|nr:TusE/DsrC/DsvC family sulfur relay protein [Hyphomicrobiales bacterium]